MSGPNDPKINGKYNYVYKLTNKINNKIYYGVHRTNNLDDGYMGSGLLIKRAINKHGIENFCKEIIEFFDNYIDALNTEKFIVNYEFINRLDNYNVKEGGFGACKWSEEYKQHLSDSALKKWESEEFRNKMRVCCYDNVERNKKISIKVKSWIKNNPEKHKIRMDKINKNPIKIEKMRLKHLGSKRSEEGCKNIANAINESIKNDPSKANNRSKKGKMYIYNKELDIIKSHDRNEPIPDGWIKGGYPSEGRRDYTNLNKGSVFAHRKGDPKSKRFKSLEDVPPDYILGRG